MSEQRPRSNMNAIIEEKVREALEERVAERNSELIKENDRLNKEIADLKEQCDVLQNKQEILLALMDNNPSLIFLKDESGKYVYLNNTYKQRFIGYEDWQGKTDFDFWSRESAEIFRQNDADVLHHGELQQFLEDSKDTGGTRRCWLCYKFPFIDSRKKRYVAGIGIDATDRILAEEALQASEHRFRRYFELGMIGMAITSVTKGWIEINEEVCRILGYSRSEIMQKTWEDLTYPEDLQLDVEKFDQVLAGEIDGYAIEKRYIHKTGRIIQAKISVKCIRRTDGSVEHFIVLIQDITQQKRTEDDLRQSRDELDSRVQERTRELGKSLEILSRERQRLYDLLETLPVMICLMTPDYKIPFANRAFRETFGELEGKFCYEYCLDYSRPCDFCESHKPFETGQPHSWELSMPDRELVVSLHDIPFTDVDGSSLVLQMGIDITEHRKLEEQLGQAHKMEAIGTLAGGIAHDFNNILAAIIGFSEMIEEDLPRDDPSGYHIQRVLKAAARGRDLVKQILSFSRKSKQERAALSVSSLTKETIQLLRASIPTTIEMDLAIDATKDMVVAAPIEIQQITMNLVTNAAFAMRNTGGTIKIMVENVDFLVDPLSGLEPGSYIQLTVKDTGTGMAKEVMNRIFDPYFTTKGPGKGTGMGLSVVYGIVNDLHGAITVTSKRGVGSTFQVLLPLAEIKEKRMLMRLRSMRHPKSPGTSFSWTMKNCWWNGAGRCSSG